MVLPRHVQDLELNAFALQRAVQVAIDLGIVDRNTVGHYLKILAAAAASGGYVTYRTAKYFYNKIPNLRSIVDNENEDMAIGVDVANTLKEEDTVTPEHTKGEQPAISNKKRKINDVPKMRFVQRKLNLQGLMTNSPALSNLPPTASSVEMNNGTSNELGQGGLKETPVDDVYRVFRGPPDYTFASLPFFQTVTHGTLGAQHSNDISFRMTSPLDAVIDQTFIDFNAGAGSTTISIPATDAGDTLNVQNKARWFDFYAGMYKYYHVVSARWKMVFENMSNDLIYVHKMHYNDQLPPVGATNQDILQWADCESHLVGTHAVAIVNTGFTEANETQANEALETGTVSTTVNYETNNHVQSKRALGPVLQLSGDYQPGQFNRQIRLDADVENWTAVTALPKLPERLLFRVKNYNDAYSNNSASSYDRSVRYRYHFSIEYLVEFKELKDGLKYPVQRQPLIITIQNDPNVVN